MALLFALPTVASAATYEVNVTEDGDSLPTLCEPGQNCTLRRAIEKSNATAGKDLIVFAELPAGTVLEIEEAELPEITGALEIRGDTADGAKVGVPAIELRAREMPPFSRGLRVHGSEGTLIEGLAIGGFGIGIEVAPEDGENARLTQICSSYLGVELDGVTARPNEVGLEVFGPTTGERPVETEVGHRLRRR